VWGDAKGKKESRSVEKEEGALINTRKRFKKGKNKGKYGERFAERPNTF